MDIRLVYITCPDMETAERIGGALVAERLAACCNAIPGMVSIYEWEGEIRRDAETVLLAKTAAARVEALTARVVALHPYDEPAIVALPVEGGSAPFLRWIAESVS